MLATAVAEHAARWQLLEAGTVRSVIDRTHDLSEVQDALRYLGEGHARAKIAIATDEQRNS